MYSSTFHSSNHPTTRSGLNLTNSFLSSQLEQSYTYGNKNPPTLDEWNEIEEATL